MRSTTVSSIVRADSVQAPTPVDGSAIPAEVRKVVAYYLSGHEKARVTRETGLTTRDGDEWITACYAEAVRCNRVPRVAREFLAGYFA